MECLYKQAGEINFPWEIIVVDNNSNDDTVIKCQEFSASKTPMHIFHEPKQGVAYARIRGFKEANFAYIGLVDQDNWLDEDWLVNAFNLMENNPNAGIICGKGEAVFETEAPAWFTRYQANYAVGPQYSLNGPIKENQKFLYDAGSILRKTAVLSLIKSGFTPMLESRSKNKLLSGDDTEIQIILRLNGWEVHYNDNLRFKHFMPISRLKWQYFLTLKRALGASKIYLDLYEPLFEDRTQKYQVKKRSSYPLTKLFQDPLALLTLKLRHFEGNYRTAKASALLGEFLEQLKISGHRNQIREKFNRNIKGIIQSEKT